uniref:Ovule protein n=1 Tax=Panagrolaimus sp. JU765 TaxID=591449 RepID=A0AC34RJJ6_9BILA
MLCICVFLLLFVSFENFNSKNVKTFGSKDSHRLAGIGIRPFVHFSILPLLTFLTMLSVSINKIFKFRNNSHLSFLRMTCYSLGGS